MQEKEGDKMPYTKRKAHHGRIDDLLDYIMDEEKTDGGLLITGLNCHPDIAKMEFKNIAEKFGNNGNRVGYHLIQSFCPDDDISPQEAHEIGVRLCKELYPNFQAVVTTHIDKGHIHNHIALNSVSLKGKKLNDKRTDTKEGLYAFMKKSNEISAEYGCYVMPDIKFKYNKKKTSDMYYAYRHQTWRQKIVEDMIQLKLECKSMNEFITKLFDMGYDIKYGKYISVKPQGKERFVRLKTLGDEFSEDNLRSFFQGSQPDYYYHFKKYSETDYNQKHLEYYRELQIALELTSSVAIKGGELPQFQKTRRKAEVQAEKVQAVLDLIERKNIQSFSDLEMLIKSCRSKIHTANIEIRKYEREHKDAVELIEKAQTFLQMKKEYDYAMFYKSIDEKYEMPEEIKLFNDLQKELGITTEQEAKEIIKENGQYRIHINKMKSEIYEMQQELFWYDTIKEEHLIKSGLFLHNVKVGNNRLDYSHSTDEQWCINLPYCDYYIMVDKKYVTYNHKYGYNTLFLIDDKKYQIYTKDENNELQKTNTINGEMLEDFVEEMKQFTIEQHKDKKEEY